MDPFTISRTDELYFKVVVITLALLDKYTTIAKLSLGVVL